MATYNRIIHEDVESVALELRDTLAPLSGRTLLVTGGSGFLCSYLLDTIAFLNDRCWTRPCSVICVDNLKSGSPDRTAHLAGRNDFHLVDHDISKPLDSPGPVHWLVHGASIASPTFYRQFPLETIDANVSGTRNVLEFARRQNAESVVVLSTSEIYGDPDPASVPTPEDYRGWVSCTGPRACYDESKRLAETLCSTYYRHYKLPVKVVRPFNVYGPGQRLDDRRIIPDLIDAALHRRPIVLFSNGRATRAFCYVADAIRAIWRILLSDENGEAFNVGNDAEECPISEVAGRMRQVAGPPWLEIEYRCSGDADYLTDNPQRRCPDLSKLRSRLGWDCRIGLTEGLRRTLLSYMNGAGAE